MSTTTTTTAPGTQAAPVATPAVTPSVKLATATYQYVDLTQKVERKFESLIEQATLDKNTLSYNRDQCRVVIQAAFQGAYERLAKEAKMSEADAKAYVDTGMKKQGPNISKVLSLTFPKTDAAAEELAKAKEAGLGLNAQLKVATGGATTAEIIAERQNKASGAAPETARPPSGTTTTTNTPQPPTPETAQVSKLTPRERAATQMIGLIKFVVDLGLTIDELPELFEETCAEYAAAKAEDAEKASK